MSIMSTYEEARLALTLVAVFFTAVWIVSVTLCAIAKSNPNKFSKTTPEDDLVRWMSFGAMLLGWFFCLVLINEDKIIPAVNGFFDAMRAIF